MKKTEFTLEEILNLDMELNGLRSQNGQVVHKGVLDYPVEMDKRYHLTKISETCSKEKKVFDKLRDDLIKEHGTANEDGSYVIPSIIEQGEGKESIPNPAITIIEEQLKKVLEQIVIIEHKEFKIEDFSKIESGEKLNVFFKLFD